MYESNKLIRKTRIGSDALDTVKRNRKTYEDKKDERLYNRAQMAWNNLDDVRMQRSRAYRFVYGDQWADTVTVMVDGEKRTLTMREYLSMDGQIPQQTNQLVSMVNTILGVTVKEQNEPVCNARDRGEQQYGELLTSALQACNDANQIRKIENTTVKDIVVGGIGVAYEYYGYKEDDRRRLDSWTQYQDPNYLIMETTFRDPRLWDMTMIGRWVEMPRVLLNARFAHNRADLERLDRIYGKENHTNTGIVGEQLTDKNDVMRLSFMTPVDPNNCCVAEIWTLETKERVRAHDWNEGTEDIIDADDKEMLDQIKAVNKERVALARQAGFAEDEIPTIDLEYFTDEFWYCRMMGPGGVIIEEYESPYPGKTHPFIIAVTPFVDGRIEGYIADGIDHQIALNRALVLQDWIARNQVKGFAMIPQQLVPDGMENEEFVRTGLNMNNFFFYDAEKARGAKPEVFHASAVNYDAGSLVQQIKGLMESSTAISGAIQGKTPYSGTSAALYAQQTANSSTPIASLLADIRTFMTEIATKKTKNIAYFYDTERFDKIMGNMGEIMDNENMNLNDVAYIEWDIAIKESTETPMYRAISNDYLLQFWEKGAITLEELLENGSFPFGDRLLQQRQARQAEAEANGIQPQMPVQAQGGGPIDEEAMEAYNAEPEQYGIPVKSTREIVQ